MRRRRAVKTLFRGDKIYSSFGSDDVEFFGPFGLLVESGAVLDVGHIDRMKKLNYDSIVELDNGCVIPGLIDAHVHLATDLNNDRYSYSLDDPDSALYLMAAIFNNAKQIVYSGITSCRDLGAWNGLNTSLRKSIERGMCQGPFIVSSGEAITVTGGAGNTIGITCDGVEAIRTGVRKQIKNKADVIKLMVTGNVYAPGIEPSPLAMTGEEIRAGVEIAHTHGRKVAVHTHGNTGIRESVNVGVDSIEHGVYLSEDIMDVMVKNGTFFVPTLSAPYFVSLADLKKGPDTVEYAKSLEIISRHNKALLTAFSKGVKLAVGSDSGSFHNYFDTAPYELVLMERCGIPAKEVLKAATVGSAELLGIDKKCGTLKKGMRADFILLKKDPLQEIETVTEVKGVWREGLLITS
jgi:imidazolonepropionase-like amidohydrolase